MGRRKLRALVARLNAIEVGADPPAEFRIFKAGENYTTKDERPFIFDDAAAVSLMAEYLKHGVDVAIDCEHLSLDQESTSYDPDARGWCNLQLRNGDLWAINVRWTPDGEMRLRERRQRYISPVFTYNKESLQILALYNIAICATPATYEAPPLVAASKKVGQLGTLSVEVKKMDALKAICAALGLKEDSTIDQALAAIKAMQEPDDKDKDPEKKKADEAAADDPDDKEKMAAALNRLPAKIRGVVMAAVVAKESLAARLDKLEKDKATSEVETFIASNTDKIPLTLEPWARTQPIESLRAFVKGAVSQPRAVTPPAGGSGTGGGHATVVELTPEDKKMAKLSNIPEAAFLESKKKRIEAQAARQSAR